MSEFTFRSPADIAPKEWLRLWASRFPTDKYDPAAYKRLLKKRSLSAKDFVAIGRWKDGATGGRWRPNVASVAHDIWKRVAAERPKRPTTGDEAEFLDRWLNEQYMSGAQSKRFGLSRATRLLHFLSAGEYPIFDSRVRRAMARLLDCRVKNDVRWYLGEYCGLFQQVAKCCGTRDLRAVDKALFAYGGRGISLHPPRRKIA
jgi:hypothetical protein